MGGVGHAQARAVDASHSSAPAGHGRRWCRGCIRHLGRTRSTSAALHPATGSRMAVSARPGAAPPVAPLRIQQPGVRRLDPPANRTTPPAAAPPESAVSDGQPSPPAAARRPTRALSWVTVSSRDHRMRALLPNREGFVGESSNRLESGDDASEQPAGARSRL